MRTREWDMDKNQQRRRLGREEISKAAAVGSIPVL